MKLEKFKEKDKKKIGIILFTITCILLITGVILYRTFAIFETNEEFNVINGSIEDVGDLYFSIYIDNKITKNMPEKNSNYVLDYSKSYCGVLGKKDPTIYINYSPSDGSVVVEGMKEQRTKCTLYFIKGEKLIDKIKNISQSDQDDIHIIKHNDVTENINDGFKQDEYRYVGSNPNNYVTFNNENAGYRIIGLVNVMTDEKTVEQRIKLISTDVYQSLPWDTNSSNNWASASLRYILNKEYFNHFTAYHKNFIENVVWNLGAISNINISAIQYYVQERGTLVNEGNTTSVYDAIAIMYPSDYAYASSKESCYSKDLRKWDEDSDCYTNDWLYLNLGQWTLTHQSSSDSYFKIMYLHESGVVDNSLDPSIVRAIKPVFYLDPDVLVNSNTDGSLANPYQIFL